MVLKLPRTIRLDPSDSFVFEHPAEPGEWAVTGSFLFWDADVANLTGKPRAAFRSGFVGVVSLGFSTLVTVTEASEAERARSLENHDHSRGIRVAGSSQEGCARPGRSGTRSAAPAPRWTSRSPLRSMPCGPSPGRFGSRAR